MQACMVRAAIKTLSGIDYLAAELQEVAAEGFQLAKSCAGELRPEGWDSEAFCTNLANAKQGKLGTSSTQGGQTQLKVVIEHCGRAGLKEDCNPMFTNVSLLKSPVRRRPSLTESSARFVLASAHGHTHLISTTSLRKVPRKLDYPLACG